MASLNEMFNCYFECERYIIFLSASDRWLMSVKWLEDSLKEGKFLTEEGYGSRRTAFPLQDKKVFFSRNFVGHQHATTLKSFEQIVEVIFGLFFQYILILIII